jgi:hypothetical protein
MSGLNLTNNAYSKYIKKLAPPQARPHLETLMKTVLKDAFVDGWFD